jgi:hypothetical protein
MEKPFNVSDDRINTLFNILFRNAQDKNFKVFDNKTDKEILSVLQNGNVGFNKINEKLYLCINIDGVLYKTEFVTGGDDSRIYMPDYNAGVSKTVNTVYTADDNYYGVFTKYNNNANGGIYISVDNGEHWSAVSYFKVTSGGNVDYRGNGIISKGVKYKFTDCANPVVYPFIMENII